MAIRCPNCNHSIELARPIPGHYRPACPTCHVKFDLLISNDANEAPRVSKLPEATATQAPLTAKPQAAQTLAPNVQATSASATEPPPRVDRAQYFTEVKPQIAYDDLHGRLGGYQITKKLGQGGMGSVYLARQISLDRDVALKTLSPTLAEDPQFVARFTREAYAAAQLTHHNVVQIHDIGQDKGTNFFSMELVDGTNLAGVVEREGRLDPITAVTYVLQAARGLKFAHDHGLIHRDVKPENLLLNNEGIVKVADLGLVKRANVSAAEDASGRPTPVGRSFDANTTQLNTSMGTPAYMAPEQARDATKVDGRADIYSLGCTLYDLVCGRPPFSGKSALEVMTKHQKEAITPPEKIVANLPKRLSEIITRMTAKNPDARYPTMSAIVKDLEDFLGVEHGGSVRGAQDQIAIVGAAVERFNAAPFARVRFNMLLAFGVLTLLSLAIGLLTLSPWLAGGAIAFAVVATLSYQLVLGVRQRTVVFAKVRQLIFGASILDWLTWLVGIAVAFALLYLFGQLNVWLGVAIVAIVVGVGFHSVVDHVVAVQREEPLAEVDKLIRAMRAKGLDEDGIRGFIAKFSGRKWEAFYEALFGYESKIEARRLYGKGERGRDRARHAVWRDWLIAWIDRRIESRKIERERRLLAKLEQRALEARGIRDEDAESQAHAAAAAVVSHGLAIKGDASTRDARAAETLAPQSASAARKTAIRPEWLDEEVPKVSETLEGYVKTGYLRRRFGGPFDILLGRRVRFMLAAVVLIGAGRWAQINGANRMLDELRDFSTNVQQTKDLMEQKAGAIAGSAAPVDAKRAKLQAAKAPATTPADEASTPTDPLRVPGVPDSICDAIGSWNGLLAGTLLLLSVVPYGHLMSLTVIAACAFALFGHEVSLPVMGEPARWLTGAVGAAVSLLAMLFFRRSED